MHSTNTMGQNGTKLTANVAPQQQTKKCNSFQSMTSHVIG